MRKNNKNKTARGLAAISLAAIATLGLAGCKADEPMVLYGMPDDTMIQEELDKAASETSESASTSESATSESASTSETATLESDAKSKATDSEAVDINEDKSNDENVLAESEVDAAIEVAPEK